jgi:hypothetical protein
MAGANALGQRGPKCVTAAPWKSPMMAWGTFCGCYFRVADYLGATRKASNPSSIHVELGIVNLDSSELNFLP